jgi:hypothetical protein
MYTNPSLCIGVSSVNIPFTLVGCPNKYALTWDAAALAAGFSNTPMSNISSTSLNVNIPPNITTGQYNANVYVENSLSGIGSNQPLLININALPTVSLPSDISVCNNASVSAISFIPDPVNASITWTNNNNTIGLSSAGVGNIPVFVAKNATLLPQIAQISIVPSINGCIGNQSVFSITVQPSIYPLFDIPSTIC